MTASSPADVPAGASGRSPFAKAFLRFARTQPLGLLGLVLIVVLLLAGTFANQVAPYDPLETRFDALLQAPSAQHWFGTDGYGRDIFSRIVHGARPALLLGLSTALIGSIIGGALGAASAYFGGRFDAFVSRMIDIMLSIPLIVAAMVVVAILGRRVVYGIDINLMIAIILPYIPVIARVMRAAALPVRESPYIDAARALGFSHMRIIFRHMVPNLVSPWLVLVSGFTAQTILLEASLSYLGLGVAEPAPAWGLMLSGVSMEVFSSAPWVVIFPGLAISVAVFSFSLLGDALRDAFDPKSQHR
jgi:peptide/nickel transport system permease protein